MANPKEWLAGARNQLACGFVYHFLMLPLLVPASIHSRSIIEQLKESLARATAVRACVAFWTLGPEELGDNFLELLQSGPSFICVDVHWPSDMDVLADFVDARAVSCYVFCRELYEKGSLQARQSLMHTKMLVVDLPDGEAEVWVGSHNFTAKALKGTNREVSVIVPCKQSSPFYEQARNYLEAIRKEAVLFTIARLAEFKALQRNGYDANGKKAALDILTVLGPEVESLPGKTLLLLGDNDDELANFPAAAKNEHFRVRAANLEGTEDYVISAHVQSSGYIDELDELSFGIDFAKRPYAIRSGELIPYVSYRDEALGGARLKEFKYWVNIKLGDLVARGAELQPVKAPAPAKWVIDSQATKQLRKKLEAERSEELSDWLHRPTGKVPRRSWERRLREDGLEPDPVIRVAKFGTNKESTSTPNLRAVEQVFRPEVLRLAKLFYEAHFQPRYFNPREGQLQLNFFKKPPLPAKLPAGLEPLRQKTLLQKRKLVG